MKRSRAFRTAALAAILAFVSQTASAQVVTTLAGSGARGSADGPAPSASFNGPQGLAVDQIGTVYVADTNNLKIRKVSSSGLVTTLAGSGNAGYNDGPGAAAYFFGPLGVAADTSGNVWVADMDDGIDSQFVKKITPDGVVHNLNLDPGGDPVAVATDGSGNLYVLDLYAGILKIAADGTSTVLAKHLTNAWGVAVDGSGTVYVADTGDHRILKIAVDGVVTTLAGSGSRGAADGAGVASSFSGPRGVAVDGAGNVYVADTGNNLIRKIAAGGVVMTLAGSVRGRADGDGVAASFDGPFGVAVDHSGNLYVADTGNNLIRKITLTGVCGAGCNNWTVPSTAHSSGADGSFWTSDLTVYNRGSVPVSMTLKFLGNNTNGSYGPEKTLTLDPYQTVTYADVLSSVFGISDGWGAVQVLTDSDQLTVRSRTSTLRAGGSVGDGAPGVRQSAFFTDQTSPSPVLTGLREDDRFRSNIILVNGTTAPLYIRVYAIDSSGAAIGSKSYTLRPLGMVQDSRFLTGEEFGGQLRMDVTVTVSSPTPGAAFTASAVLIDNASNAPTTVLPQ
jgi:sugar lactone lactonase YvrE